MLIVDEGRWDVWWKLIFRSNTAGNLGSRGTPISGVQYQEPHSWLHMRNKNDLLSRMVKSQVQMYHISIIALDCIYIMSLIDSKSTTHR